MLVCVCFLEYNTQMINSDSTYTRKLIVPGQSVSLAFSSEEKVNEMKKDRCMHTAKVV